MYQRNKQLRLLETGEAVTDPIDIVTSGYLLLSLRHGPPCKFQRAHLLFTKSYLCCLHSALLTVQPAKPIQAASHLRPKSFRSKTVMKQSSEDHITNQWVRLLSSVHASHIEVVMAILRPLGHAAFLKLAYLQEMSF